MTAPPERDLAPEAHAWATKHYPRPRHAPAIYGIFGGLFSLLLAHAFVAIGYFSGSVIASRIDWEPVIMMVLGGAIAFGWAWRAEQRHSNAFVAKLDE
jgi:hypothetical protein